MTGMAYPEGFRWSFDFFSFRPDRFPKPVRSERD